jgi:hypothetical protein
MYSAGESPAYIMIPGVKINMPQAIARYTVTVTANLTV